MTKFRKDVSLVLTPVLAAGFLTIALFFSTLVNIANADSTIATITVGTGPYGAVFDPDNGYIYTANVASNSVTAIDGSTNKVVATITKPAGQSPRELAFNSDNGYIYVADAYSKQFL
jgi:YVTN family beta-propeller protein